MQQEIQYFKGAQWFVRMMIVGAGVALLAPIAFAMLTVNWWWVPAVAGLPLVITGLILWLLFRKAFLRTAIHPDGITVQFNPLGKQKLFMWEEIAEMDVVRNPRPGFSGNKYTPGVVYFCMMNKLALRLQLRKGGIVIIGIKDAYVWKHAVERFRSHHI